MRSSFLEVQPRNFKPMAVPGLENAGDRQHPIVFQTGGPSDLCLILTQLVQRLEY
jgi:hypothetical protein